VRKGPRIAQSALFATLFIASIFLTILGALLSYSEDIDRIDQAWDILRFNLVIIVVLAFYLAHRVWTTVFSSSRGQAAPLRVRGNMEEARQILDGYVTQEFESLGEDVAELQVGIARSRTDFGARISFTAELLREAQTREWKFWRACKEMISRFKNVRI